MRKLMGRVVHITQVCHKTESRDKAPSEIVFKGQVEEVEGHMIKIINCHIVQQPYNYSHPGTRWFNTMAADFKHIDE